MANHNLGVDIYGPQAIAAASADPARLSGLTQAQAETLVEQLFRWLHDGPLDSPEQRALSMSTIACVVCDTASAWLAAETEVYPSAQAAATAASVLALHQAYQQAKQKRGL